MNEVSAFLDWLQDQRIHQWPYAGLADYLEQNPELAADLRQSENLKDLQSRLETAIRAHFDTEIAATSILFYLRQAIADYHARTGQNRGFWYLLRQFGANFNRWIVSGLVLVVFGVLFYAMFSGEGKLINDLAKENVARGLITFIFSIGTISVAIILVLYVLLGVNVDETQKRFQSAKEILTILIGIFGTIVGFYFGSTSAPDDNPPASPPAEERPASQVLEQSSLEPESPSPETGAQPDNPGG